MIKKLEKMNVIESVKYGLKVGKARNKMFANKRATGVSFGYPTAEEIAFPWKQIYVNGKQIPVVANGLHVHANNATFGCVKMASKTGSFVFNEYDATPVIMVDEYFMAAPAYVKKFIIAHESAHITNGDLKLEAGADTEKRWINVEKKADRAAAVRVGKDDAIAAIDWMISVVAAAGSVKNIEVINELIARKEALVKFDPLGYNKPKKKNNDIKCFKEKHPMAHY